MTKLFWLGAVVFLASACSGRMPLVGLDKKGGVTEAFIDEEKYERHLEDAIGQASEKTLAVLEKQHPRGQWRLRTVALGFAVNGEAGIGPFKLGIRPGIRAAFSTGSKPPIP